MKIIQNNIYFSIVLCWKRLVDYEMEEFYEYLMIINLLEKYEKDFQSLNDCEESRKIGMRSELFIEFYKVFICGDVWVFILFK